MFSKSNKIQVPFTKEIDNTPRCVLTLRQHPEYQEKNTTCVEPSEIESRRQYGKCKFKCCMHCEQLQTKGTCLNEKTKTYEDEYGNTYTKTHDSICSALKILVREGLLNEHTS